MAVAASQWHREVRLFEDEGHGFRNEYTQIQVLEETEAFFRKHLNLDAQTDPTKSVQNEQSEGLAL